MRRDIETIKNQVWQVAEVGKKLIDEAGKLACLWLDHQAATEVQAKSPQTQQSAFGEPLMTVKELAAYLKISEKIIRQKTEAGEIRAFSIGKRDSLSKDYRYRLDDVLRDLSNDPLQAPVTMQHKQPLRAVK